MFSKIKTIDKILFAKHLSLMLSAGVSLSQSVSEIEEQSTSKELKKILKILGKNIREGNTIAGALKKYEKEFGVLFINMIKIGEESGTLEKSLKHLAKQLEDSYELKRKVKGAMIYPVLVLSVAITMGLGLAIFIMPKLLGFFKSMNMELPLATKILLAMIEHLEKYGIYYFIGAIIFIIIFKLLLRIKKVRLFINKMIINMPIFGKLVKKLNIASFARTLAILLKSGVTIVEALDISAVTLGNLAYEEVLKNASSKLKKGEGLSAFFKKIPKMIPPMVAKMVEIGEKSGTLEETLFYIADFYDKEVDATTKNLSNILEPVLLVAVGIVVGVVAISILMPIYQFTSNIQAG